VLGLFEQRAGGVPGGLVRLTGDAHQNLRAVEGLLVLRRLKHVEARFRMEDDVRAVAGDGEQRAVTRRARSVSRSVARPAAVALFEHPEAHPPALGPVPVHGRDAAREAVAGVGVRARLAARLDEEEGVARLPGGEAARGRFEQVELFGETPDQLLRQPLAVARARAAQAREQTPGGVEPGLDAIHVLGEAEDGEAAGRSPEALGLRLVERRAFAPAPLVGLDLGGQFLKALLKEPNLLGRPARVERD
jgi:hypothetical protein